MTTYPVPDCLQAVAYALECAQKLAEIDKMLSEGMALVDHIEEQMKHPFLGQIERDLPNVGDAFTSFDEAKESLRHVMKDVEEAIARYYEGAA